MYVSRVELTDIRGFTGARSVDLNLPPRGGRTVLAGRDESGKTTLLQAVALTRGGKQVAFGLVADFGGWITDQRSMGRGDDAVLSDLFSSRAS